MQGPLPIEFGHCLHDAILQKADRLWASLVEEYKFLKDKSEVHEKRRQLKRKEIIISAFGRHNCGKSTLLNTLLGNRYICTNCTHATHVL